MSAIVPLNGSIRQLDLKAEPDEQVTEEQAKDPARIARLIMRILKDLATLKRRFWPRHLDFEDIDVDATGTTKYRFPHGFSGRVRYWPVEWKNVVGRTLFIGATPLAACLEQHADTDANTLVLVSQSEGTVTLRVEEAG